MALKQLKRLSTSPGNERCKLKLPRNTIFHLSDQQKFTPHDTANEAVGKEARHSQELLMGVVETRHGAAPWGGTLVVSNTTTSTVTLNYTLKAHL